MRKRCNNERISTEPPDNKPTLLRNDIKPGIVLVDISGKKWKLGETVGTGGFGEIYLASDNIYSNVTAKAPFVAKVESHSSGPLFVENHCYHRILKLNEIVAWQETMGLSHLAIPHFVTSGSHQVKDNKYRFLILPRYEKDLEKILETKRKFNLKTVLTIALQIIDALEYIHSNGYVHSDIKASNILFNELKSKKQQITSPNRCVRYHGCRPLRTCKVRKLQRVLRTNFNLHSVDEAEESMTANSIDQIYLLDYGLATRYTCSDGEHKPFDYDQRMAHAGTILFCSRDAHKGVQSRRSDLECLGYNLIHWLTSDLPWSKYVSDPEIVHKKKCRCIENVRAFLQYAFNFEYPRFLYDYFMYLQKLEFIAEPDYKYIKTLFKNALFKYGYKDNSLLDFDNHEGWGRKQKKTKCNSENVQVKRAVQVLTRSPLKSNLPLRHNLRNEVNKKVKRRKDWATRLMDPEVIIKKAKSRERKLTETSDSNSSNGIQHLDLDALNPTWAMVDVYNKSIGRLSMSGHSPRDRGDTTISHLDGYTSAMVEVYNRKKERELEEYRKLMETKVKNTRRTVRKSSKQDIRKTKSITPKKKTKLKPVVSRTYSLRG